MQAIFQSVTDRIVSSLEAGSVPWVKPWCNRVKGVRFQPHNITTKTDYHGVNILILGLQQMEAGYSCGGWATYKQIQAAGGQVRKGEKGSHIIYYETLRKTETDASGDEVEKRIPMLKSYCVFNVEQVDGLNYGEISPPSEWAEVPDCERTLANTGAVIRHGGNRACYSLAVDMIQLPERTAFNSAPGYYASAFHELTHWTGHQGRLDREAGKRFGDGAYAAEELVAELGAAFLCAKHEIDAITQHARYIGSWLQILKGDNRAIFKAAALAQKAADYVMAAQPQPVRMAA